MTPEEFEKRMKEIDADMGVEESHCDADALMCELLRSLGFGAGIDVYEKMRKWYA